MINRLNANEVREVQRQQLRRRPLRLVRAYFYDLWTLVIEARMTLLGFLILTNINTLYLTLFHPEPKARNRGGEGRVDGRITTFQDREIEMTIPDFQSLMLPLLKLTSDGHEKSVKEAVELLAQQFGLSESEQKELTPGGKQRKFYGRFGWARTYLQKACLLEQTGKARFRITARGQQVMQSHPGHINIKFLKQFPEFLEFTRSRNSDKQVDEAHTQEETISEQTPQEILEENFQILKQSLAQEILGTIKSCSPQFFEKLVVDVLVAMGYGGSRKDAGQAVGQSGDGGIDGIIKEDKLGLDAIYIQAKRWEGTVGAPVVQGFAGALMGKKARKGVFITASHFSQQAINFANSIDHLKIILIDGEQLVNFMIDHDVGVTEEDRYILKKIDQDYFEES